jgi:glycosyltransferase involved in cell wall biosynthesis
MVRDLCFTRHALTLGYEPVICCPQPYSIELPIFDTPRLSELSPENGVQFVSPRDIVVGPGDLAFFHDEGMYEVFQHRLSRWTRHEQIIQAVRDIKPTDLPYTSGYALRLLTRPMARMVTNDIVLKAVRPYLPAGSFTEVVEIGHDTTFFSKERTGGLGRPIKVAYTTGRSELGDRVAALIGSPEFEFRTIRKQATSGELRGLYHWADVFLATPLAQEDFYLPGIEAMAAGNIVLTPDVGGNSTYCNFGENCLLVGWEDETSYVEALKRLASENPKNVENIRHRGYETLRHRTWEREERQFGRFLERLTARLDALGPRLDPT